MTLKLQRAPPSPHFSQSKLMATFVSESSLSISTRAVVNPKTDIRGPNVCEKQKGHHRTVLKTFQNLNPFVLYAAVRQTDCQRRAVLKGCMVHAHVNAILHPQTPRFIVL